MKAKMDALYEDFMRETPPAEKQSVKASSGKTEKTDPKKGNSQWPLDNLTRRNSMLLDYPAH